MNELEGVRSHAISAKRNDESVIDDMSGRGPEETSALGLAANRTSPGSRLRIIACGSDDDGRADLIDRLLRGSLHKTDETGKLPLAHRRRSEGRNRGYGTADPAADCFFSTANRGFVLSGATGHARQGRGGLGGRPHADVSVIMVDARNGINADTLRHAYTARLSNIRTMVLAVSKMNVLGYESGYYSDIVADFEAFLGSLSIDHFVAIPLCATAADNVLTKSPMMPWYQGPTLIEFLENLDVNGRPGRGQFPRRV